MIESGEITAFTSTLTWNEVVWVVRRLLGRPDSIQAGEKLTLFPNLRFVPASEDVIRQAQKLVSELDIAPRDAIHAASALGKNVDWLVSDDPDFDLVKGLRRQSPSSFKLRSEK